MAAASNEHLSALAEFGKNPQGGVSRLAYSEADLRARDYVMGLMRAATLSVSIDAAGNLVGRRTGSDPSLPLLSMGSHIDSVPDGGNYDGDVGSLGAIEVAQVLAENDIILRHPLEVLIFQDEEGGLIGSSAVGRGLLTDKDLNVVSRSGKTVREGITSSAVIPQRSPPYIEDEVTSQPISNCTSSRVAYSTLKGSTSGWLRVLSATAAGTSRSKASRITRAPLP